MVSVVIPNYNKGRYIHETINSVRSQSFKNWECIIVDDCSSDSSVSIIKGAIYNDIRFKIFENKKNKGGSFSRNLGLYNAKGDYIIFLDADDILAPDCLEKRINHFNKNKYYDYMVFPMGTFFQRIGDSKSIWNDFNGNLLKRFLSHNLPWHTMMVLWKRTCLIKLNGFQVEFSRSQDVELHTRALLDTDLKYKFHSELNVDCFFRISNERILDYYSFCKKDIDGKFLFINYFHNLLIKKDKKKLRYIKGTLFESYSQVLTYYQKKLISRHELDDLLSYIAQSNILFKLNSLTRIYIYVRKKKIYFKGMNKIFKKFYS